MCQVSGIPQSYSVLVAVLVSRFTNPSACLSVNDNGDDND
jgi:hypothetical protein